jgi:hypothetical protein
MCYSTWTPYPETNVQDIEPRATADTRIRARSPGSKGEFTKISNDVNSGITPFY